MDELALLRDFRLEDAAADGAREHARAALHAVMTRRRLRLPRRRYTLVLAFAVAALLAAAAFAIVHEFVIGTPAPVAVQKEVGMHIAVAGAGGSIPFPGYPYKASGPTLIAAAAQTSLGRAYLLLTPIRGGGQCQFLWYAYQRSSKGQPMTGGYCGFGKQLHAHGFGYGYDLNGGLNGHPLDLIEGFAPGAVRVRIGDRFFKTPFGWFIAEYRGPELLTAYGAHGGVVAHLRLKSPAEKSASSQPTRPTVPIAPTGRPHVFVSTRMGWVQGQIRVTPAGRTFRWLYTSKPLRVAVSPNNKGGVCIYVHVDRRGLEEPHCISALRANEVKAYPSTVGWVRSRHGPSWVEGEAVLGAAGANISHVQVRFSDGRSAPAPLREGAIFYLIPRPNYAAGHRPVELVGRDASGHNVARKRLPFAG
jgi:hypothetical protein